MLKNITKYENIKLVNRVTLKTIYKKKQRHLNLEDIYNSTKKYSPKCGINNHNGLSQIEFQVELTTD